MSTRDPLKPRPTRSETIASRSQATSRKRIATRRRQRLILTTSIAVLLMAAVIFILSLLHTNNTASAYAPIDGVQCGAMEGTGYHIHQHLEVVVNGTVQTPPAYVGIMSNSDPSKNCLYWIHTHTPDGVIHVEAPAKDKFALGAFLDIWAKTPTVDPTLLNRILSGKPDQVYVDGKTYTSDIRTIPLGVHTTITLEYGKPLVKQKPFAFPKGE